MNITAAIVPAPGADFVIGTLQLEAPRADEVLVEISGVGLCHTDLVFRDQFVPFPTPAVLGHEGAGTVVAVGAEVTGLAPGDTVVVGFSSCGHCSRCEADLPSYCREFPARNYAGARSDGSTALSRDGTRVASHFFGQSSFASHVVTPARNAVKVDATGLDLAILGPLGCGFQTGAGSVLRSLDCPPGSTIAIFGGGPVGLAAVMAAAHRGCRRIVLVEPVAARRALGSELGATDTIDPTGEDLPAAIRELLRDGVDYALETSGRAEVIAAGLEVLASRGTLGLVGVPPTAEAMISANIAGMITFGHRIVGIVEGDSDQHGFIPELIGLHRAGLFAIERLVAKFPLAEINAAIAAQARGECVKAVLVP